jgi:hypothetical protein
MLDITCQLGTLLWITGQVVDWPALDRRGWFADVDSKTSKQAIGQLRCKVSSKGSSEYNVLHFKKLGPLLLAGTLLGEEKPVSP